MSVPPTLRRVYFFGAGAAEGDRGMRNLLGGKGANLAEMTRIGISVPPGFTITTAECIEFRRAGGRLGESLLADARASLARIEASIGRRFGDPQRPLLVSVRSGAPASMPGMMDTVLNVGLNDDTVEGLAAQAGDRKFALDSYRRFIEMFGAVVLDIDHFYFEEELGAVMRAVGVRDETDLDIAALERVVEAYKTLVGRRSPRPFPVDPWEQLSDAISAVFRSWDNPRAVTYRAHHSIVEDTGTAVTVQAMVFGNLGEDSATGVAFSRNPSTGAREPFGEYMRTAQGEDVVSGVRTPAPLGAPGGAIASMEEAMPTAHAELVATLGQLEAHYLDAQDVEFTVEQGRVWILQTRDAKRTARAAVRIAVDLAEEGVISRQDAVRRVSPTCIDALLHPTIEEGVARTVLARGLPASPGAATGAIVFDSESAERARAEGRRVILLRPETTPDDIRGMIAAEGVVTSRGGITSHAAVVARQMGRCCVAGCSALVIDLASETVTVGGQTLRAGDSITIDGTTGEVMLGELPTVTARLSSEFGTLMSWSDEWRRIGVRGNADTAADAATARALGAEGIGLVRTEHMFFEGDRIHAVREMIVADSAPMRAAALEKLRPFQRGDFERLLEAMDGLPLTVRLLDPPLHEFLPEREADIASLAESIGRSPDAVRSLSARLRETNPMLGHRGCRVGLSHPEIYEMQVRALFDAAVAQWERGRDPRPQVMIPLVSMVEEFASLRARIAAIAADYGDWSERLGAVPVGTMIELPRACLTADRIAEHADFLSFGTNDLTQTVFGFSRDDASSFLPAYLAGGLLRDDPFVALDIEGVGALIEHACRLARSAKPTISIGVCGEQGGHPASVAWMQRGGLDYVSCNPYRVPVARLAAAQAAMVDDDRAARPLDSIRDS